MPTHEHTLVFRNNHLFVRLEEGLFLLDTGCPMSHGPAENATIFGRTANIPSEFMGLPFEHVTRLAGPECVGMIGMDLLCNRHTYWDGPNCRLVGGDVPLPQGTKTAAAEFGMGIICDAGVSGNTTKVIFDTGAQYGYLTGADLAAGAEPAGIIDDFNPLLGEIKSESWWVEVELCGIRFRERMGVLPPMGAMPLAMLGVQAIIGCSWMHEHGLWLMPDENRLAIS